MIKFNFFFPLSLHDSWSPLMKHITSFHDHVMMVVILIVSIVIYMFMVILVFPCFSRFFKMSESMETLWTVLPCMVLASLVMPSLATLYMSDEIRDPILTIKVIGHQWFWSYEYEDLCSISSFDSYMIPTFDLNVGDFRLLEVDKSVKIPLLKESRAIITSSDVIHSWTVPGLGVKVDAVPGRLNQLSLFPLRVGVLYGQCSEICGAMHSFMPIRLEIVSEKDFINFIKF